MSQPDLVLTSPRATAVVSAEQGGRVASFVLDGHELLVDPDDNPMMWGSYPMIPFAGRIRDGSFTFDDRRYELPRNLPPHAIHGYGFIAAWAPAGPVSLRFDFGAPWPFAGHAVQHFALGSHDFVCTIEVHADEPQPVTVGWHPWFRRPLDIDFVADEVFVKEADYVPSGRMAPPPVRPWDDCFRGVHRPPRLRFGHGAVVTLTSTCDHWVVYDQPEHAICVEPQSGPPDGPNLAPAVVVPGRPLVASMTWSW